MAVKALASGRRRPLIASLVALTVLSAIPLSGTSSATAAAPRQEAKAENTTTFNFSSRTRLVAAGWDFIAKTADGKDRDTEVSDGSAVSYSGGGLKVQAQGGDLWRSMNNSRNTLFHDLPSDWTSMVLTVQFAPVANDQQVGLGIYSDDDNYVQLVRHYSNGQSAEFISESRGTIVKDSTVPTSATAVKLRLVRDAGTISGAFSDDGGSSWTDVGDVKRSSVGERLVITVGGNRRTESPAATLQRLEVVSGSDETTSKPTPTPTRTPRPTATPTSAPSPTSTPTSTPTQTPSQPTPSRSAAPVDQSSPTTAPSRSGFPTRETTGVPAGWVPSRTITGDYTVTGEGSTLENVRISNGNLYIRAKNVTVRNVELVDGRVINFFASQCSNGLLLENVSIVRKSSTTAWDPAVEAGGYTARGLKIDGWWEGLRVGGTDFNPACGPVLIEDSWINIQPPAECYSNSSNIDWHGDGLQGYEGAAVTIRDTYMQLLGVPPRCGGNATFFYPDQGNSRATVDNVLLAGGGFTFRLGTPGSVKGLKILDGTWEYGPSDVRNCSQVDWGAGNEVVRMNADGSLTSVRSLKCG